MKAQWVIDSSVGFSWVHPDQASAATDALLDQLAAGADLVVPALWFIEMANGLLVLQRRKKLTAHERTTALDKLAALRLIVDEPPAHTAFQAASELAEQHGLTVYDATYLEVAIRRKLGLATRDGPLRQAAKRRALNVL